jgi:hypothetical protein
MFSNTTLYIPDYVVVEDIPTIIKYFDYYNIAKVKKVQVFKHCEPEYYVEDRCPYGFALIEIDYYYDNQGARNFYRSIENKKGLIVYDDPNFWEVQFSPFKEDNSNVLVNSANHFQDYSSNDTDYASDEECFYNSEELEEEQNQDQDEEEEEPVKFNTDSTLDNFNYASYENNYASFKKKQSSKKQKLSNELYEIKIAINNICTKQDKLLKLLLINNDLKSKKQKNNQKIKEFKTSYARRLHHQSI